MNQTTTPQPPATPRAPAAPHPRRPSVALSAALMLTVACAVFWGDVLIGGRVLLPGAMLRGFAPFGGDPKAGWTILQWDALAQYFPWRAFASSELHLGRVPLWNPHQFAGAPFVANGQSAVFYPLSLPFWLLDTARAFGMAAFLHSILAAAGAFWLLRRWGVGGAASIFGALAWTFGGYLAAWNALPTLAHTASWLPLLLLLFERASDPGAARRTMRCALLALALCCALLAGHAQVFVFLIVALLWRAATLGSPVKSLQVLAASGIWAAALGAMQLLPTLELARLGHRAGAVATEGGWNEIAARALQPGELLALAAPAWPMAWGSLNENFPYVGAATLLLAILGAALTARRFRSPQAFALGLALLGLGTALAWPPARWAYFGLPGAAQFGGLGRALVLWSLGASLLAAFGLDALARRFAQRSQLLAAVACAAVLLELGLSGWTSRATASREEIYPATELTNWLRRSIKSGERVAFVTPRQNWLPREGFGNSGRIHPRGVLPPNGAMAYGLYDVGGYDSLSPAAYRKYLDEGEAGGTAPQLNGNMMLPGASNARLSDLGVRYLVALSTEPLGEAAGRKVFESDGCAVWERELPSTPGKDGRDFSPGWRDGKYQPQSFRLGAFLSLCALALAGAALWPRLMPRNSPQRAQRTSDGAQESP